MLVPNTHSFCYYQSFLIICSYFNGILLFFRIQLNYILIMIHFSNFLCIEYPLFIELPMDRTKIVKQITVLEHTKRDFMRKNMQLYRFYVCLCILKTVCQFRYWNTSSNLLMTPCISVSL